MFYYLFQSALPGYRIYQLYSLIYDRRHLWLNRKSSAKRLLLFQQYHIMVSVSFHYDSTCWQSTVCSPSTIKIFSDGFLSWIKQAQPGRDIRRDLFFLSNLWLTKDRIISDSYGSPIWLVSRISNHYSKNISSHNAKQICNHSGEHITGIKLFNAYKLYIIYENWKICF